MKTILLVLFLVLFLTVPPGARSTGQLPDAAPLFAVVLWDMRDMPMAVEKLRGRPLIVNFWARWCGPCRAEIPEFVAAHRRLRGSDVLIVGVGLEERAQTVREFAQVYEMEYLLLLAKDQGQPLLRALGNANGGLPYTLVIDRHGKLLSRKLGVMTKADLDDAIASLK